MRIAIAASEGAPYIKSGGLGDVIEALPSALSRIEGNEVALDGSEYAEYLVDELMQAARRRFYRPEYIACPGCGRTMYNLEGTFEEQAAYENNKKCFSINNSMPFNT